MQPISKIDYPFEKDALPGKEKQLTKKRCIEAKQEQRELIPPSVIIPLLQPPVVANLPPQPVIQHAAISQTAPALKRTKLGIQYYYNQFVSNFKASNAGFVTSMGIRTHITTKKLRNVVRMALERVAANFVANDCYTKFTDNFKDFIVRKQGNEMRLHQISALLGKGTFGSVYSSIGWHTGRMEALKLTFSPDPRIQEVMQNEIAQLQKIHAYGKVWGIQSKPYEVVYLLNSHERGYLGERYEGNYFDVIDCRYIVKNGVRPRPIPLESKLFEIHQLLFGLSFLHSQGYVHRDLKPNNVLFKYDPLGLIVHIADFGDVRQVAAGEIFPSTRTSKYICQADMEKVRAIKRAKQTNMQIQLLQIGQQQDVFAMGYVIYMALTGNYPFPDINPNEYIPNKALTPIPDFCAPLEIRQTVEGMLALDAALRPPAQAVFVWLDMYLKQHHTSLHTAIHQKIEAEYKLNLPAITPSFAISTQEGVVKQTAKLDSLDEIKKKVFDKTTVHYR